MKFVVLKCDDKNVRPKDLTRTAKKYENILNGISPEIDDPLYAFEKKDYTVIPLFYGLTLQRIEDDLDGFDIYIRELEEIKDKLDLKSEDADIPIGRLCCFKPIDHEGIYFGYMAGKVVNEFEDMSCMYVLKADDRYFFSRSAIIKPDDVHTSNDAKKYFLDE